MEWMIEKVGNGKKKTKLNEGRRKGKDRVKGKEIVKS